MLSDIVTACFSPLALWVLLLACMAVNALCVASFFALVKIRYAHLISESWVQLQKKKAFSFVLKYAEPLGAALYFYNLLSFFLLGIVGYLLIQESLMVCGSDLGPLPWVSLSLIFFLFQYLVSYYLPRILGMAYAQKLIQATAWLLKIFYFLSLPWVFCMKALGSRFLSLLDIKPEEAFHVLDLDLQIRALGDKGKSIPRFTYEILENALRMKDLEAADILLPRGQVQYLDLREPVLDNIKKAKQEGYTRYPLCEGDLDHTLGIIHMQDLFCAKVSLEKLDLSLIKRPIIRVPLKTPIQRVLRRLLQQRMHMALVTDEFRRTVGLITLEHILEELVGDIQDEFDHEEDFIQLVSKNIYKIAGLTPIHEVEEILGLKLSHQGVSTFGGLITSELGHIPEKNEKLTFQNLHIQIEEVSKKRIIATRVKVLGLSSSEA
jgi:CBS domain containing-hemolysin-like protein